MRVLRRSLLLYGLGLIYYGGISHHWADIRYLGVLQRIGICYLFASLMFLNFNLRGMIATFVALLLGYWALMALFRSPALAPVPSRPMPISPIGSMPIPCLDACGIRPATLKGC